MDGEDNWRDQGWGEGCYWRAAGAVWEEAADYVADRDRWPQVRSPGYAMRRVADGFAAHEVQVAQCCSQARRGAGDAKEYVRVYLYEVAPSSNRHLSVGAALRTVAETLHQTAVWATAAEQ